MTTDEPSTLDRAAIAQRIPHSGSMCLLEHLHGWTEQRVHCSATSHRDAGNPLRSERGLLAVCAIEYAAQAMALHGALTAHAQSAPAHGYLASVRSVRLHADRLDHIAGALQVHAVRIAGDAQVASYQFSVNDEAGAVLVDGRLTVVLNAVALHAAPPSAERVTP